MQMSPKTVLKIIACVLVLFMFVSCSMKVIANRELYSGFGDVMFNIIFLFEDHTRYARNYSEAKFRKIHEGQTKTDVLEALGEPLTKEVYTNTIIEEIWRYTEGPPDANYWSRGVIFGTNQVVREVHRNYYVD